MKKITLAAIIAFSFASCSKDHEASDLKSSKVMVTFGDSFLRPMKSTSVSKNVDRGAGTIPVGIDQITVTAANTTFPDATTVFNMTEGNGDGSIFYLDGIASGNNTFTATATTTATPEFTESKNTDVVVKSTFEGKKISTPFAHYTATKSATINLTAAQTINFNMATSNGKLNTYIYTDPTLTASGRKVEVVSQLFKSDNTNINAPKTYAITGSYSYTSCWSDDLSVAGNYISIDIKVYASDGTTVENTYNNKIYVAAFTTTNTTMIVNAAGVTTSQTQATFNFPVWVTVDNN